LKNKILQRQKNEKYIDDEDKDMIESHWEHKSLHHSNDENNYKKEIVKRID